MNDIPEYLKERINYVARYVGDSTTDWLVVKKQLFLNFPNKGRKLFSKRHACTKKQIPNKFDKLVMNYWKELTGVDLVLHESKLHDKNWTHKKKGWALQVFNEKRRSLKNEQKIT